MRFRPPDRSRWIRPSWSWTPRPSFDARAALPRTSRPPLCAAPPHRPRPPATGARIAPSPGIETTEVPLSASSEDAPGFPRMPCSTIASASSKKPAAVSDERRRRLAFWGTLALMRCVGSSAGRPRCMPCASRMKLDADNDERAPGKLEIYDAFDGDDEDGRLADDAEPVASSPTQTPRSLALIRRG